MQAVLPIPPDANQPQQADAQAPAPISQPAVTPRFISLHTLLMRIDALKDLPSGTVNIRKSASELAELRTDRIPMERMAEFHQQITDGKVYVLWGYRQLEFEELGPEWPKAHQARTRAHHLARYRALRSSTPGTTPEALQD